MARPHVVVRPRTSSKLVLLVDRDEDTRQMYAEFLRLGAWQVDEAGDGREALARAIARRPDVIVTETRLPGISGYDLCQLLRRDSATAGIPIVVVTADAYRADIERARAVGADAVLVKPCLPETLLSEITSIVGARNAAPAAGDRPEAAPADTRSPEPDPERAETLAARTDVTPGKRTLKRAHRRGDTTAPPVLPPALVCPSCDQPLSYRRSHVGGVSAKYQEQWDYFVCAVCGGTYQYRARTRKLRKVM
jgi:CheY-like chemotaxis protein